MTQNNKIAKKIGKVQDYTEKAVDSLKRRTSILQETTDRCVESCEETLDIIKEEERERTVALDKLIRESEEKKK